jgi:hypothetical protein
MMYMRISNSMVCQGAILGGFTMEREKKMLNRMMMENSLMYLNKCHGMEATKASHHLMRKDQLKMSWMMVKGEFRG